MLSDSYVAEVYYRTNQEDEELNVESWFIKVRQYWLIVGKKSPVIGELSPTKKARFLGKGKVLLGITMIWGEVLLSLAYKQLY